jgi:hypothetical protein
MKKIVLILMVIPILGTINLNAQKLSKNDAFDILSKWEGKWKNKAVFEESVWMTEGIETRGSTETNFILSNNYLEVLVYNNNVSKYIICYDQNSNQFNRWEFQSDGSNTFWTGKWNNRNNTMMWDYIDFIGSGTSGEINENFISEKIIKTKVIMKDSKGKTLLKISSIKEKI